MSACLNYSYTRKDEYVKEPSMSGTGTFRTCPTDAERARFSRMERTRPTRRANQSIHQFCCLAVVQPRSKKYSGFPKVQISCISVPSRASEGRCATSRNAERDAVDAGGALDGRLLPADGEVVWSRRPDAGVKLAGVSRERRGQKSPVPGESTYNP
jgi:hypothetical protein